MLRALAIGLALTITAKQAHSEESTTGLPVWELGAGIGSLWLPHYPGADLNQAFVAPFPLLIYRGETVRADRGAIRGILYEAGDTRGDIRLRG
ncbi:MAG: MipA/OmpV family protein, partial [Gammaproteobacteria bacterium]|nr:MipA/OmpV family protein [Gammaproteobacteria bacterium]